jgi:hypothetical protein
MLVAAVPARSDDHLVSQGAIAASISDAAALRARDLASVDQALASPRVRRAAARTGFDIGRLRGALPQLSDEELRDLGRRASALRSDPAAGHSNDYHDEIELLVFVALFGALVLVLLQAAR